MPLIEPSSYQVSGLLRNGHFHTIYTALLRKVRAVSYQRQRLETPDGDFLDLDWSRTGSNKLLIVLHGLEASAEIHYVRGMIHYFNKQGWDGAGMNFRGCSGEVNRKLRAYHSGETGDLKFVIDHVLKNYPYNKLAIVGFSLGGNVLLKFLGEGNLIPDKIKSAVAISVPCDLAGVSERLNHWENRIYLRRFMYFLNQKLRDKTELFPGEITLPQGRMPRTFFEYDHHFTGPVHGFEGAEDYWQQSNSLQFLHGIHLPTLLITAKDDPFLTSACFPKEIAQDHPHFYLDAPDHGGHVGFLLKGKPHCWTEQRAFEFIDEHL